jgi:hypothetical protein
MILMNFNINKIIRTNFEILDRPIYEVKDENSNLAFDFFKMIYFSPEIMENLDLIPECKRYFSMRFQHVSQMY